MNQKLKCPFCGAELEQYVADGYECPNWDCEYRGRVLERRIWQALISGKKAQDALKRIANYVWAKNENDMKWHVKYLRNIARIAITKLEK